MEIPLFLAISPQEMASSPPLSENLAWLGCHFSETKPILAGLPVQAHQEAFLIIDDSVSVREHDSGRILEQLRLFLHENPCKGVLLDFQRPPDALSMNMAKSIANNLPCPVGVSEGYAKNLDCPVFLPPIPPNCPAERWLNPWKDREIWLDVSPSPTEIRLTADGCTTSDAKPAISQLPHSDDALCCHYRISASRKEVIFHLQRTHEDIGKLLKKAAAYGVTKAFGLYQEL